MVPMGSIFMIHQLKQEGHSVSEIARRLNMDRKTVRKKLESGLEQPAFKSRPAVVSVLDQYKPYLQQKIELHPGLSATRLLRDIVGMGYTGSLKPSLGHFRHRAVLRNIMYIECRHKGIAGKLNPY